MQWKEEKLDKSLEQHDFPVCPDWDVMGAISTIKYESDRNEIEECMRQFRKRKKEVQFLMTQSKTYVDQPETSLLSFSNSIVYRFQC